MKTGGGKAKGHDYEQRVARLLSEHFGVVFRRTPLSGGWDTMSESKGSWAPGDIVCVDLAFPWCVETKKQEGWTLEQILRGSCETFPLWWKQCITQADSMGKYPLLVFSRNFQGDFAATSPVSLVQAPPNSIMITQGVVKPALVMTFEDWLKFHERWEPKR